ncbi:MAG: SDR family oxidoreductase, partial [Gammaproteobacteria bacterium]|nr:SDR family oxidoreductase [Gammaproteobacteria bacterium]
MKKRILIAGCGRIGQRLGQALAKEGHTVFGLRRSATALPIEIQSIQADLLESDSLSIAIPEQLDQVVYILTPSEYTEAGYAAAYVEGLSNLLNVMSAQAGSLPRVIFASSTSVYGQNAGEWVDENSPTQPERFSGRRLLQAEQLAKNYNGEFISVRFSGIYGPGRERLIEKVKAGASCQAAPPLYTNRIHETDCVGILKHIGGLSQPAGCYLASDQRPSTQCEVMQWLAETLNVEAPTSINGTTSGRRCNISRLQGSGYHWIYPDFRSGYAPLINGDSAL